jgi:hypothetical protein
MKSVMSESEIARVCHEVNRAYCASIGDHSQQPWENAPQWQQESAINGVRFVINNPQASQSAQHENWMKGKLEQGWQYGETKSELAKTHPCLVPYDQLPREQQTKDALFQAVVRSLTSQVFISGPRN